MPTLSAIRGLPNYELFQLKLVRVDNPVTVVAVLTQKTLDLGVRFDNDRKDYRFKLSEYLGNDNGKWTTQDSNFEALAVPGTIKLDLNDRANRYLVADLQTSGGGHRSGVKYNLDKAIRLVDYLHPKERETYFRLGVTKHALALDEYRANFSPSLWDHGKTCNDQDVRLELKASKRITRTGPVINR